MKAWPALIRFIAVQTPTLALAITPQGCYPITYLQTLASNFDTGGIQHEREDARHDEKSA
jgi:hypothetical protein